MTPERLEKIKAMAAEGDSVTSPIAFELAEEVRRLNLQNQELQNENAKLKRNLKCAGCGHSKENHDSRGCLVWVEADAGRKCLCKIWSDIEKRKCECIPGVHKPCPEHGFPAMRPVEGPGSVDE